VEPQNVAAAPQAQPEAQAQQLQPGYRLDTAGLTHPGRVRANNEDAYLIATLQRSMLVHDASPVARGWFTGESAGTLLVVADGMGGQGGGDIASKVAVSTVVNHLLNCMPWATARVAPSTPPTHSPSLPGVRDQLMNALAEGDSTVRVAGAQSGVPQMGTTLTLALLLWPIAYIAHVGDSRCYLMRDGQIERLTTDHTLAQKLSEVSPNSVDATSRLHHILWNSLGASDDLPQPEIQKLTLQTGDTLLLCSDGLTKYVSDQHIARILSAGASAEERCAMLVERANAAGGADNVTAVIAQIHNA